MNRRDIVVKILPANVLQFSNVEAPLKKNN